MLMLTVALLLSQVEGLGEACSKNTDCIMSEFSCCEGCFPPSPYATTRAALEKKVQECSVMECAAPKDCPRSCDRPPPLKAWVAVCEKKVCIAKLKPMTKRP